jgi:hypothetical protein
MMRRSNANIFQFHQLGAQGGNARARHFRQPGILDIGNTS